MMAVCDPPDTAEALSLLDLPHVDILYHQIFRRLPLSSLFQLRATCTAFHDCVSDFFTSTRKIDLTHVPPKFGAEAFAIIANDAQQLRELVVRNSADWLTDAILTPVIGRNPHLEKVDLTSCSRLRHLSISKLMSCSHIKELYLRECQWLDPDSLSQLLWLRGVHIERLDLGGCWDIDDRAVMNLANCCKNLRFLSLSKIYGLTDQSIMQVAKCCVHLRHLNITNCWRVTDEAIRLLGEYCRELEMLQVQQCRDITEISLARLRARGVKMDTQARAYSINRAHLDFLKGLKIQI